MRTILIPVRSLSYPTPEWEAWRRRDVGTIDAMIAVTGHMGMSPDTYRNQALMPNGTSYNYWEVKVAKELLVQSKDLAYRPDQIVYQNYRVSKQFGSAQRATPRLGPGIEKVERVFLPKFFSLYDQLFDLNCEAFSTTPARKEHPVDLFAFCLERRRCGFWEAKARKPGSRGTEVVGGHQWLMLCVVRYLADSFPSEIFRLPGMRCDTEFVELQPAGASHPDPGAFEHVFATE